MATPSNAATPGCYFYVNYGRPAGSTSDPNHNGWTASCVMNRNVANTGGGVLAFQRSYNDCYSWRGSNAFYPLLAEDGSFGTLTERAVMRVQTYEGLVSDGSYGPLTSQRFMVSNGSGSCSSIA